MSIITKKLMDVCKDIVMGQSPESSSYNAFGVGLPFYQGKTEFCKHHPIPVKWCSAPKKIANSGDILMSVRAPVGATNIANEKCCIGRGLAAIRVNPEIMDRDFLLLQLKHLEKALIKKGQGSTFEAIGSDILYDLEILTPDLPTQQIISKELSYQLAEIEKAREATKIQIQEVTNLANAIIYESLNNNKTEIYSLGDVIYEVKIGIGENWNNYPVYGATRKGIAIAKEPPGKNPQRYKPIVPGTVFYNPMRILIGSIAFAEDDVEDGITSPDYVVLKGKNTLVNSRWFYYWLRSPLGQQCINSLARGAVRERMLFNRLAEGSIDLPEFVVQEKAAAALKSLKQMQKDLDKQLLDITKLPTKILAQAFNEIENG
ncbi:MAG: restriction endonuclease subunit S [Cyclobacteriaceae bacterium]|nr:restriction endonuclease subunit S [Cyclobacteriaceae bacterium]